MINFNEQVFIIMQLKFKSSKKRMTIVCLHLKAFKEFEQKRLEQTKFMMDILKEHLGVSGGDADCDLSNQAVLVCGDFNGAYFEQFYKVMITDPLLKLKDAHEKFFNKSGMIRKSIDYVFYTNSTLKLARFLDLRIKEKWNDLPSLVYPSDHLSLVADFQFC